MKTQNTDEGLKRVVGVPALTMSFVNGSIGAGMFALPAIVSIQLGAFGIICYLFCGMMLATIMLCYAEIGSRITSSGGSYAYVEAAFGPFAGYIINWLFFFGWGLLSDAAVLNILTDSLSVLFPVFVNPLFRAILFFVLLSFLTVINILGVKDGAKFVQIITVVKLLPLFGIIFFGFSHINMANLHLEHLPTLQTFGNTALILFFAFAGFEASLNVSGELKDPKHTVPISLLLGGVISLIIILSIQIVVQGVLGTEIVHFKDAPVAAVAEKVLGSVGKIIVIFASVLCCWGIIIGDVLTIPRLLFAGAKDGLFPNYLAKVHPKYATPYWAIITYAEVMFILSVSAGFQQLAILASASILLIYLSVILATIKLRAKTAINDEKTFKIPGGLAIPILGIVSIIWLLFSLSRQEMYSTVLFIAVVAGIYFGMKRLQKK